MAKDIRYARNTDSGYNGLTQLFSGQQINNQEEYKLLKIRVVIFSVCFKSSTVPALCLQRAVYIGAEPRREMREYSITCMGILKRNQSETTKK